VAIQEVSPTAFKERWFSVVAHHFVREAASRNLIVCGILEERRDRGKAEVFTKTYYLLCLEKKILRREQKKIEKENKTKRKRQYIFFFSPPFFSF